MAATPELSSPFLEPIGSYSHMALSGCPGQAGCFLKDFKSSEITKSSKGARE